MPSFNPGQLIAAVKKNCTISDAHFWGNYSICGLLLRLRDLYRTEHEIKLWEQIPQSDITAWISGRERLWHELEDSPFMNLILNGQSFDPFDVQNINNILSDYHLVYGAGIGIIMKPTFFLAELITKRNIEGFDVYVSGNELARDLSSHPALLQDSVIFARRDAATLLLWDKFEELRLKRQSHTALSVAFSEYHISAEDSPSEHAFEKILAAADNELETFIYHEIGEAHESKRLGTSWKTMLSETRSRRAELYIRAVKDMLSDTAEHGMLAHIIRHNKKGSLGFYIAFLGGFRKPLFPEVIFAFGEFSRSNDWTVIESARFHGYKKASNLASQLLDLFMTKSAEKTVDTLIEKQFVNPLSG